MDKNKATKKEFGLGIFSVIIGGGCIVLAHRSEVIANCIGQGTKSLCPHPSLVLPIFILIIIGLFGVVLGGTLMGSNQSAIFNHNTIKKEVKSVNGKQ